MDNTTLIVSIVLAVLIIAVVISAICLYKKYKRHQNHCPCQYKEGFISAGSEGAHVDGQAIVGPHMYSNQMIQNGKDWQHILNSTAQDNEPDDGPGTLGAGKGEGFDKEVQNQKKYAQYLENKGKMSNEEANKVTQAINNGIANPLGEISLFNRGKQVAGNLIIQDGLNATVGMMAEEFFSERQKNRNIYTASKVVEVKGFHINPENMGAEFTNYHPSKIFSRDNKRVPYVSYAARPDMGIKVDNGQLHIENKKTNLTVPTGDSKQKGVVTKQLDNGKTMATMNKPANKSNASA